MINQPYGGKLIDKKIKTFDGKYDHKINIDLETAKDVINICNGLYSPLEGFMNKDELMSVIETKKLKKGISWTIPIFFNINKRYATKIRSNDRLLLCNKDLGLKALLKAEDIYTFDLETYCNKVFGTIDTDHVGVRRIMEMKNNIIIGGELYLVEYKHIIIPGYNFEPKETRKIFHSKGWNKIVGFQTRNPAHLAHEYMQKMALEFVDGLFINPIIGLKKKGDFKDEVVLNVYEYLTSNYYFKGSTFLGIFPSKMHYAGPREAVFHAIIRKNFGCTHFIVGRDHAGVGNYYDKLAAHKIFDEIEEIGIEIMKFSNIFYSPKLRMFTTSKVSPYITEHDRIDPSGTEIRKLISEKNIDELEKFMRKEVIEIILSYKDPFEK